MPAAIPPDTRQPLRMTAGSTAVEFTWDGDRWRHAVTTSGGRLESLEGDAASGSDSRWPASPALVEISLVERTGDPAVLGVGQAGRSHFSLSVRRCPRSGDTLLFEAACRIHEVAGWLGSTYRDSQGRVTRVEAVLPPAPATVIWSYRIGPAGIEPTPHQPTAPAR